jgi:hypothetical protein
MTDHSKNKKQDEDERAPELKEDLEARPDDLGTDPGQVGPQSAGQSGSVQGLSSIRDANEESTEELAETGQDFESSAVDGAEDAADHPERPTHSHEDYGNPEDVPPVRRDDEAA